MIDFGKRLYKAKGTGKTSYIYIDVDEAKQKVEIIVKTIEPNISFFDYEVEMNLEWYDYENGIEADDNGNFTYTKTITVGDYVRINKIEYTKPYQVLENIVFDYMTRFNLHLNIDEWELFTK